MVHIPPVTQHVQWCGAAPHKHMNISAAKCLNIHTKEDKCKTKRVLHEFSSDFAANGCHELIFLKLCFSELLEFCNYG